METRIADPWLHIHAKGEQASRSEQPSGVLIDGVRYVPAATVQTVPAALARALHASVTALYLYGKTDPANRSAHFDVVRELSPNVLAMVTDDPSAAYAYTETLVDAAEAE